MVREVTKTYYIGSNGSEFSSREAAEDSFLFEKLSKLFNKKYGDYSFLISEAIVYNRTSVSKFLRELEGVNK